MFTAHMFNLLGRHFNLFTVSFYKWMCW